MTKNKEFPKPVAIRLGQNNQPHIYSCSQNENIVKKSHHRTIQTNKYTEQLNNNQPKYLKKSQL